MGQRLYIKSTYNGRFATIPVSCIFSSKYTHVCPMNYAGTKCYEIPIKTLRSYFDAKKIRPWADAFGRYTYIAESSYGQYFRDTIRNM